ncbi:MAG: nitrogen regulation protein NR(II) [Vicinamibacterales bacterium]
MTRLSIRLKQILGVTGLVGVVVVSLSVVNLARIARLSLEENRARGELLANAVFHRAFEVVTSRETAFDELAADAGVRSILQAAIYSEDVTYAAIVDTSFVAIAHSDPTLVGQRMTPAADLDDLLAQNGLQQLWEIWSTRGRTLEWRAPLLLDDTQIGDIRIGISTLLARRSLSDTISPALATATGALLVAILVAFFLTQAVMRPIHVIQSSLTRLGRGELGVTLDLEEADVQDLRGVFDAISAQLVRVSAGGASGIELAQLSKRIAALGRLTAGVAHEVKNPLNAMTIHLELLRQKLAAGAPEADVRSHADIIGHEIKRLDAVVQGFLKFARPEDMRLERVAIASIAADVAQSIRAEAEAARVKVEVAASDRAVAVEADPAMLRQALLNLAVNALQAMPHGGTLRFACETGRDGRALVRVHDTGTGIPPEQLARVFDLYFTTKAGGSGIGLSMVFRTVQLHHGDIDVESTPGAGTTFTIALPRAA